MPEQSDGDTGAALASVEVTALVMPGATDLYFPVGDAELEARSISHAPLLPIPSLWGHPAGASQADAAFVNDAVRRFLAEEPILEATSPIPQRSSRFATWNCGGAAPQSSVAMRR